jgi:ATP-binding cassette subfamily B protein
MSAAAEIFWPAARLDEAVEGASRRAGLRIHPRASSRGKGIEATARALGVEAEPLDVAYADLEARLRARLPALVDVGPVHADGAPEFAAVIGRNGSRLLLLAPDLEVRRVDEDVVLRRLCRAVEAPALVGIDRVLAGADLEPARVPAARRAILRERLGAARVQGIFALGPEPGSSVWEELARVGVRRRFAALLGAHAAQYALWLLSWWVVGRAALEGRFEAGWFLAWALLLLSLVPFRLLATWSQGAFAVAAGGILKKKLLVAALRLDPERVRGSGMGDFVGRVIESEAVESLALSGGIAALTAGLELVAAGLVLAFAPGGALLATALCVWTAVVIGAGLACHRRRRTWTSERLALSHDLIEKMVGHRTRLAQEPRGRWHAGEDAALERYAATSERLDRATAWLVAVAPRGWLLIGVLLLAPAMLRSEASSFAFSPSLAAMLGGVLLAYLAIQRLAHGIAHLGGAAIAWKAVAPMLEALAKEEEIGEGEDALPGRGISRVAPAKGSGDRADVDRVGLATTASGTSSAPTSVAPSPEFPRGTIAAVGDRRVPVLQARELGFRHAGRSEPLFKNLSLDVLEGDRILLEGSSGCGKSTFASLLTGLREPESGIVLLRGVDRGTVGAEAWRRRVASAPQFHENHVMTETFAFNLLMGQRWPPTEEDLKRAEDLCGELGLSDLIARMPAGLNEMVGESGWQLSHGERSRLFMARALLQPGDFVVLDESFAALDPATLEGSMRCALSRAKTLLVIAHP